MLYFNLNRIYLHLQLVNLLVFRRNYMKNPKPKRLKKRIFNSWITSLVSITLVLVMLGILGLILINAKKLSDYVRERIGFTLVLDNDLKSSEITQIQNKLDAYEYVKSTRYINKEEAGKELTEELGEDFTEFLGYNPLYASIEVKLKASYTNPDSLNILEKKFLSFPQVTEVYYQKNLVSLINQNVQRISIVILVISALLAFIFIALIHNTIRISVYSQRFTINTMQMVGATNSFIRKPFLMQSFWLGIYGSLAANFILFHRNLSVQKRIKGIISLNDVNTIVIVSASITTVGLLFSFLSTYFAVSKFLRMKFDDLFY